MSFSLDMTKAIKNINAETERVVRGTIFGVSSRIIKATPVAAPEEWKKPVKGYIGGTLRGAWNASITTPDKSLSGSKDKNGAQTINNVNTVLSAFDLGEVFYLTNPQPYAMRIEYGWSRQAPAGMVRVALADTQAVINAL